MFKIDKKSSKISENSSEMSSEIPLEVKKSNLVSELMRQLDSLESNCPIPKQEPDFLCKKRAVKKQKESSESDKSVKNEANFEANFEAENEASGSNLTEKEAVDESDRKTKKEKFSEVRNGRNLSGFGISDQVNINKNWSIFKAAKDEWILNANLANFTVYKTVMKSIK